MKNKLFVLFVSVTLCSLSQTKGTGSAVKNSPSQTADKEIKISRNDFLHVKTVKDVVKDIPKNCKIISVDCVITLIGGKLISSKFKGDDDFQAYVNTVESRSVYLDLLVSCQQKHLTYKVVIK